MPSLTHERVPARPHDAEIETSQNEKMNERGAAMLEFALVASVLFLLIFGVIEGGLLVRASSSVSGAADEAARRGAVAANNSSADLQILQQIAVRGTHKTADIEQIIVYRATSAIEGPPQTCIDNGSTAGLCNVYDVTHVLATDVSELPGCAWCPTDRRSTIDTFDYLGVYINGDYNGVLGLFEGVNVDAYSVLPLEVIGGRPEW